MCVNCNLLCPISDKACDLLGIEKRKYLVIGNTLFFLITSDYFEVVSYAVNNYKTMDLIQRPAGLKKLALREAMDDTHREIYKHYIDDLYIYEGKLQVLGGPLPVGSGDLYAELFDGLLS